MGQRLDNSATDATRRRVVRRLAFKALFIMEQGKILDIESLQQIIADDLSDESDVYGAVKPEEAKQAAIWAQEAWQQVTFYDRLVTELAPEWPSKRQPPVDRAIIRLALYEIHHDINTPAVAINEAVELAKSYAAEKSPSFINGLLDKAATVLDEQKHGTEARSRNNMSQETES